MADYYVRGSRELAALGRRLKHAGEGEIRKDLLRGIRTAAKKAIPDVRASAAQTLPRRGGLAERVAQQSYGARTSLAASGAKVSIVGRGMKELRDIDSGRLRHPVFGNRGKWVQQSVEPGFFTKPLLARVPSIRSEIDAVMDSIGREITRRGL